MITARPQKKLHGAKVYFGEHLSQGDYHSENQKIAGQWFGRGAERLSLDLLAPVSETAFVRLCDNLHPVTGQKLTVRQRQIDRRVFYDFVVSAPKSVSIMAVTMGDERILAAHDAAVRTTLAQMEKLAATRVRRGGKSTERVTGELVTAIFRHDSSRALDPQLHSHLVAFNATWDDTEQRWKALQSRFLFDHIHFFTEVYRSELAASLRSLGYQLRGTDNGFEIVGVAPELIERFSKRKRAIAKAEAKLAAKLGKPLSNDGRARIAHTDRERKRHDVPSEEVVAAQVAQLSPGELASLSQLKASATGTALRPAVSTVITSHRQTPQSGGESPAVEQALDFARDHLFERHSAVDRREVLRVAMARGLGEVTLEELEAALDRRPEFIAVDGQLTTREAVQQERRMIALVNAGAGGFRPLNPDFSPDKRLSEEQRLALEALLQSPDQVVAFRGAAGAGKTFVLTEVMRALPPDRVTVLAPSSAAVEVLRQEGFPEPATVQRFLIDPTRQEAARDHTVVIDEAGLLSNEQMLQFLELARTHRYRLILSGDTRQHGSVIAGDALRVLESESQLRTVEVQGIRRQVNREYREAVAAIAAGNPALGLHQLQRLGAVCEVPDDDRYQRLADDYVRSVEGGNSTLVVSPTWREIGQVTDEVRKQLRAKGHLAPDETTVTTHQSLRWTAAEKRCWELYRPGQVLTFHKRTRDFQSGDWAVVKSVGPDHVVVATQDRREVKVTRKQFRCYDVAEQAPLPVAAGDQLLLQGNRATAKLLNGQLATVRAVAPDGRIDLADGRVIEPDYRTFTHGYCVTSQGSQGKSVDHVYVAVDSHTLNAVNQKQFYVSVSRGRERVKIYTDDVAFLRESVQRPGTRLSATELLRQHAQKARVAETLEPRRQVGVKRTL